MLRSAHDDVVGRSISGSRSITSSPPGDVQNDGLGTGHLGDYP